jgi:hypothetical protein
MRERGSAFSFRNDQKRELVIETEHACDINFRQKWMAGTPTYRRGLIRSVCTNNTPSVSVY